MRERSKKAARTRREKENYEFVELAKLLPLPGNVTSQLDKATVVKLTTAYLKLRELFPYGLGAPWGSAASEELLKDLASFLLQALEGFLFIVGPNAKIIYISEGVSFYLGLSQVEMMGNNINEYIHVCDQGELETLLNHEETIRMDSRIYEEVEVARSFSLRMKCVLTKRSAGLVTDNYKLIYCRGYLKLRPIRLAADGSSNPLDVRYNVAGIVAVGNALHPTSILELKMYSHTFMFRAELDFKFLHLDPRAQDSVGYEPNHLLCKSFYKFVHVCDCFKIKEDHLTLIAKGQAVTSYYRFLTRSGGWIWMQSSFILLLNSKSRHTFVLAINHVISDCEHDYCILAEEQVANGEPNFCKKGYLESEQPPVCQRDMPKKKRKKTKSISNSSPDRNSLGQRSSHSSEFQNSNSSFQFAQDSKIFTHSLLSSKSNDFTLNIQDQSTNLDELSVNPIQPIIYDQPPNVLNELNRFNPVTFDQFVSKTKSPTTNFESVIHSQSANMIDTSASNYRSITYNPLVCRRKLGEKSTNYFQTFTNSQPSIGEKSVAINFLPVTCSHSENTSRFFDSNLQSTVWNSSSHLCDSSTKGFKSNWIANTHLTSSSLQDGTTKTPYQLNEFSSNSASDTSQKINNSFLTAIYPLFPPSDDIYGFVSSEYPKFISNQQRSFTDSMKCSETIDTISMESNCININNVDESDQRKQNGDNYKSTTQNSFSLASNYDAFAFSYPLQNSNGDTKTDSIIAERKPSAVSQELNDLSENLKNKENFGSVFDYHKIEIKKHYFNNNGDLEIKSDTSHNNQPHVMKIETDYKNRNVDTCIENSLPKIIAINSLNTDILQTDSPNISSEEIPQNWLNSNNFNNTYFYTEPLEIESEGALSVISSNVRSPFPTKIDLSFSSDGCTEESFPSLFNLANHSSDYPEQSINGNSESYFDVQSGTNITNSSDSTFGLSFFTNSSSTPLYTVL